MMTDEAGTSSVQATTSRKPSNRDFKVFLNFQGLDSRYTVVDFIYDALVPGAGVQVFYDDESIRQGEVVLEGELMEAITNSKIYIPIFSKNYASSRWCLHELEIIMKCWEASQGQLEEKTILPIFYDVDVSKDVKLKSEVSTTALRKHKDELGEDVVKPWEVALQKATKIKGWDIRNHGLAELTRVIVGEVCHKLRTRSDPEKVLDDYVAIGYPIMKDIMNLLDLDAHDVRIVAIQGIGGVGKTTLARLVFNQISRTFRRRAFLSDIREKSHADAGTVDLQKDLLSQLLWPNSPSSDIDDADDGAYMILNELGNNKVLVVLDDLDKFDLLFKLVSEPSWLGMGSRIIITTGNTEIMPEHEGFYRYKMQEMRPDDALKLFSKLVFKSDLPLEEYDALSREVINITGGLPLAINLIAPLFRNNGPFKDAWEDTFKQLRGKGHMDVREKFMISYEQLDNRYKEIFLDIACLFINKAIEDAIHYWEARELNPKIGIRVLKNRSLIEIVDGNKLWMHELLRGLGRNLVDEKAHYPGERSRLWSPEVALRVVRGKQGTKNVEAIKLEKLDMDCNFNPKEFAGLTELKFLELKGVNFENEDFKEVFSELRWLSWDDCPPEFGATNLFLKNLDVLILSENLITDDWGGWREIKAKNLRVLKCTNCRCLTKSPDFSALPKLERLVFKNCEMLREIDQSIGMLEHLTYLEITILIFDSLRRPPEAHFLPDFIGGLNSLSVLKLKFVNLPKLPDSIGELVNLKHLCLWCPELKELPDSVGKLKLLVELDISYTAISKLPRSVIDLESLKVFKCVNCQLEEVPDKIKRLLPLGQFRFLQLLNNDAFMRVKGYPTRPI